MPFGAADPAFASRLAERLADHDDRLLARWVEDEKSVPYGALRKALVAQTRRARVHPVYLGSAITGAGVDALMQGLSELLPAAEGDADGPVSGTVFKIERGPGGEKVAYVRLFSGTIRARDRLVLPGGAECKVTGIALFEHGTAVPAQAVRAGQIATLAGLADARIGDAIGAPRHASRLRAFEPPTLETRIAPCREQDLGGLRIALFRLAEQDPLINVRQDDVRHETYVSLYGEVQKEVIGQTLAAEFGIEVEFERTTTLLVERPAGAGAAAEILLQAPNPFLATVGLRVEPAVVGAGNTFRLETELGAMPRAFHTAIHDTVHETLRQGVYGWPVTDCTVTLTHSGYLPRQSHAHQRFDKSMSSTGADFRHLTPLVLMAALLEAGTTVYEPIQRFRLELPADALSALLPALAGLGAVPQPPVQRGDTCVVEGEIPAARVHELRLRLPSLTRGEGTLECAFCRHEPVHGTIPERARSDFDPRHRKEYLLRVAGRV